METHKLAGPEFLFLFSACLDSPRIAHFLARVNTNVPLLFTLATCQTNESFSPQQWQIPSFHQV